MCGGVGFGLGRFGLGRFVKGLYKVGTGYGFAVGCGCLVCFHLVYTSFLEFGRNALDHRISQKRQIFKGLIKKIFFQIVNNNTKNRYFFDKSFYVVSGV